MEPTYPPIDDLQTDVDNLRAQLDKWNDGTYDREQPHQRLAASDALDAIDAALKMLHSMRDQLVSQTRQYDDASMRRTDDLLRKIRAEREKAGILHVNDTPLGR